MTKQAMHGRCRKGLHEVDLEKADSVPFNYGRQNDSHSGYDYPPISSIFEKLKNVNGQKKNCSGGYYGGVSHLFISSA